MPDTVISFENLIPLPRYDSTAWVSARIEESATVDGPWVTLETVPLSPIDPDPANPLARNFTTDDATLVEGWYRIVFVDNDGDEQLPTEPMHNVFSAEDLITPTNTAIGALLRARTKDTAGNELGFFNNNTRPTDDEVAALARNGASHLINLVGVPIPDSMLGEAERLVALYTAMQVELSYFPEQVATGRSPYEQYRQLWLDAIGTAATPGWFITAITEEVPETGDTPGMPYFYFPDSKPLVW
jgi:hypothetical protein